jgi:hypothetical protein
MQERVSRAWCTLGRDSFFAFAGKLTNHSNAGGKRFENRIPPAGGKNRRDLLVDVAICLREKAGKLTFGGRGEFPYSDEEADFAGALRSLEREMVKQSKLFGSVLLSKFPITHKILRPKTAMHGMKTMQNRRILGCGTGQVNELKASEN